MRASKRFESLIGEWRGTSQLWLSPEAEAQESASTSSIALQGMGKFAAIEYTWSYEGDRQEGFLLLGSDQEGRVTRGAWIDSWHMGDEMMILDGSVRDDGVFSIRGIYAAPPGPDWGWKIELKSESADSFVITMYNITPEEQEQLAVRMSYTR